MHNRQDSTDERPSRAATRPPQGDGRLGLSQIILRQLPAFDRDEFVNHDAPDRFDDMLRRVQLPREFPDIGDNFLHPLRNVSGQAIALFQNYRPIDEARPFGDQRDQVRINLIDLNPQVCHGIAGIGRAADRLHDHRSLLFLVYQMVTRAGVFCLAAGRRAAWRTL